VAAFTVCQKEEQPDLGRLI